MAKMYTTHDEWLAANPLYKWRGKGDAPKPMEYVATTCNTSRTSVLYWERGDFMPKHRYMVAIAKMMTVKVETLYRNWQAWLDAKPVIDAQQPDETPETVAA